MDWSAEGYRTSTADEALRALAATGASHLAILVTAYQSGRRSNEIRFENLRTGARTPSPAAVQHVLQLARSLSLRVTIKPHVDLEDGTWRGRISPSDPEAWFESYNRFLQPWAEMAQSAGAAQFIVGTELAGTIRYRDQWLQTIRNLRSVFSGELIYAASWDEASQVTFWRELDHVGVNFFFPVTNRKDPGRFEILAGWQPWLDRLQLLHELTDRNVILTEIGYRSVDGAGMRPYAFDNSAMLDLAEQADLYWAALQATTGEPWLAGMYWWNWPADGDGGLDNTDYTPNRKPAAHEIFKAWSE